MNLRFNKKIKIKKGFTRTLSLSSELMTSLFYSIKKYLMFIFTSFCKNNSSKRTRLNLVSGFTLIEALVAISILMVAVTSPMMIAQKSLSTAFLTKDQMTASFLVQDAIEAVKNIRDEIAIKHDPANTTEDWLSGLNDCICNNADRICDFDKPNAYYCNIDTTATNWFPTDPSLNPILANYNPSVNPLKIESDSNGFIKYDLTGTVPSKFSRKINIMKQTINSKEDEAVINIRVSWDSAFGVQNIDVKNFIYNYSGKI